MVVIKVLTFICFERDYRTHVHWFNIEGMDRPILHSDIITGLAKTGRKRKRKRMSNTWGHPLSWLLSNNRLEKVPFVSVPHSSSNRLLLSNQDKGCTPSVAHSLPLPLGPALLNLWTGSAQHWPRGGYSPWKEVRGCAAIKAPFSRSLSSS